MEPIITNLTREQKQKYRELEKCSYKIINATQSNRFNSNCIRERLCPKSITNSGRTQQSWETVERLLHQRTSVNNNRIVELNECKIKLWQELEEMMPEEYFDRTIEELQVKNRVEY